MGKNYCGPDSSSGYVKNILSADIIPGGEMNEVCKIHDEDYSTPGKSKAAADLKFLGNGLKSNWWNPYGWVKSIGYYLAVAFGGGKAYKEAQAKAVK